jgi:metal-responsive CopG/Arc/MetJ family transcriptional regulator
MSGKKENIVPIRMADDLKAALDKYVRSLEEMDASKVIRQAIREFMRRHPAPKKLPS